MRSTWPILISRRICLWDLRTGMLALSILRKCGPTRTTHSRTQQFTGPRGARAQSESRYHNQDSLFESTKPMMEDHLQSLLRMCDALDSLSYEALRKTSDVTASSPRLITKCGTMSRWHHQFGNADPTDLETGTRVASRAHGVL